MKHVVWLLLAAWCAAFAQVQPVEPVLLTTHTDCGCDCGGTCGMPDCAPPPATPLRTLVAERAETVARPEVRRNAQATADLLVKFFAIFQTPAAEPEVFPALVDEAPAASVPLFKEHCAFLI